MEGKETQVCLVVTLRRIGDLVLSLAIARFGDRASCLLRMRYITGYTILDDLCSQCERIYSLQKNGP